MCQLLSHRSILQDVVAKIECELASTHQDQHGWVLTSYQLSRILNCWMIYLHTIRWFHEFQNATKQYGFLSSRCFRWFFVHATSSARKSPWFPVCSSKSWSSISMNAGHSLCFASGSTRSRSPRFLGEDMRRHAAAIWHGNWCRHWNEESPGPYLDFVVNTSKYNHLYIHMYAIYKHIHIHTYTFMYIYAYCIQNINNINDTS